MSFHQHVESISSSICGALYKIQQMRDFTDLQLRKKLVSSLVLPHISYCAGVLLGAGVVKDQKLTRLVNRGVRLIYNLPCDASISPYRRRLGWLTTIDSRPSAVARLVYIALREGTPPCLKDLLLARVLSQSVRGQQNHQLVVPNYRTDTKGHPGSHLNPGLQRTAQGVPP